MEIFGGFFYCFFSYSDNNVNNYNNDDVSVVGGVLFCFFQLR